MLRRLSITCALLVALPVAAGTLWVAMHSSDLPDAADDDLMAHSPPTGESQAYAHLIAATEALTWPAETDAKERLRANLNGEAWDPEWLSELVALNRDALEQADAALRASDLYAPMPREMEKTGLGLWELTPVADVSGAEALLLLTRGRKMKAEVRASLGLRLGSAILDAGELGGTPLFTARGLTGSGLRATRALVRHDAGRASKDLASGLDAYRMSEQAWRAAWAGEYRHVKRMIEAGGGLTRPESTLDRLNVFRRYLFQANRFMADTAEQYRELQRAPAVCRVADDGTTWQPGVLDFLRPNATGRYLISIASMQRFGAIRCRHDTWVSLTQVFIGVRAFERDHARMPSDLTELVPEYLDAVPVDPFGGGLIRYSADERIAYSIGTDLVDEGGTPTGERGHLSEPSLPLVF